MMPLPTRKITILLLVSVAEQTGLSVICRSLEDRVSYVKLGSNVTHGGIQKVLSVVVQI